MRRTILSTLALVLAVAFAAQARAADHEFAGTTWTKLIKGENGAIQVERLAFDEAGEFTLTVTEGSETVSKMTGTYTVMGGTLVLKLPQKELQLTIVSRDGTVMVLRYGETELKYAKIN
jgi:hypothetical protein